MKTNFLVPVLSVAVLGIAAIMFVLSAQTPSSTLGADVELMNGPMTIASSTVATASVEVLAASTGRQFAQITNEGGVAVYLAVGQAAVAGKGIRLAPAGGTFTIDERNLFSGAVNAIATTSSSNLTVIYKDGN